MRHCYAETVEVHESHGDNLGALLRDAASLVDAHQGVSRVVVDPTVDPDTGFFTYNVTAYLHG